MLSSSRLLKKPSLSRRGKSVDQLKAMDIAERQLQVIKISQMRQQYYYKMNVCRHPKCQVVVVGRELEVLKLMSEGYTNRVIGEMLLEPKSIIDGFVICLYNKLRSNSRIQALSSANNLGLL
jgi:ATP/maltotriose-dependent transcriptional regulator MalT